MPDLTIETFFQCVCLSRATVEGSTGTTYRLTNHGGTWECNCKGFQFRLKCKHVEQHMEDGCKWHQQFDGGEPVMVSGEPTCPWCGGPVEAVQCAV